MPSATKVQLLAEVETTSEVARARNHDEAAARREALKARNGDLTEALEEQGATSKILGVISSPRTDIQPTFDALSPNAAA
jgi:hypothetical protein